jgi:hypothetical protein
VVAWAARHSETAGRVAYLDNLKASLVAVVIAGHAWAGYTGVGSWMYSPARETTLSPGVTAMLEALLGPVALFAMGLFLLMAGLLTPSSAVRKGPARFAWGRILRLGVPLAVFAALLLPLTYALRRATGNSVGAYGDPEHLWFLEVLLIYSLGYAAWRALPDRPAVAHRLPAELRLRHLLGLAAAVATGTFLVRLHWPMDSDTVAYLHLWQWPQYLALFGLGLAAARHGWLTPVPDDLRRACGRAALAGSLAVGVLALLVAIQGVPVTEFFGGWSTAALVIPIAEGLLAATFSVWLLGTAQRHLNRSSGAAARAAFAAYLIQGHVLIGLALALRPLPLPAELKGLAVSTVGVLASFGLGRVLITGTPLGRLM